MLQRTINGFRVTTEYGAIDALHKTGHKGLDLAVSEGTPLGAVKDGVVAMIGNDPKLGNWVKLQIEDNTSVIYGHLKGVTTSIGDKVDKGEIIAYSGSTGRSTGPHLHLQASQNGQLINPEKYASDIQVDTNNGIFGLWDFIKDVKEGGLWKAFTGNDFLTSLKNGSIELGNLIVNYSDGLIVVAMALGIGAMAGSKRCTKWLYWSVIAYLILKLLGVYI